MSFLFNAPECSTSANPLAQALKTFNKDSSLQRDFAASSNPALSNSQAFHPGITENNTDAEQFYQRANGASAGHAFDLRDVRQRLNDAALYPDWEARFAQGRVQENVDRSAVQKPWAHDFNHSMAASSVLTPPQMQAPVYARSNYIPGSTFLNRPYPMMASASPSYSPYSSMDKGKGKAAISDRFLELTDDQWTEQFDQIAPSTSQSNLINVAPPSDREEMVEEEDEDRLKAEIDATWRNMHKQMEDNDGFDREMAAYEAQYANQFVDRDGEFATPLAFEPFDHQHLRENPKPYDFIPDNNFAEAQDPFEEGKRLLASGAPLSQVEEAFEEACRRDESRAEAWLALGDTLAADEKELQSIHALERAVALPGRGGESAWLSLAIAYINEGQDSRALSVLEQWVERCYPNSHTSLKNAIPDPLNPWAGQQRVTDMFLNAARAGPRARHSESATDMPDSAIDADVQVGLGVLFYGNSEYSLAKDCFEAALSERPNDFIMWNRLGATLANGGHPEEAISAYRTALSLRPKFPRSLYNLAVSCLNINCYQEAAEHLLEALELQGTQGQGQASENLWSTLRRSFFCLQRPDLAELAVPGGNIAELQKAIMR